MRKCDKCNESREESEFYNQRKVCKYCHREYVYSKRHYKKNSSEFNSSGLKETIKTNPKGTEVNQELYNYLLKL